MKKIKKQNKDNDFNNKKDGRKSSQQGKITRSWGLATRLENKKLEKPKKKKK